MDQITIYTDGASRGNPGSSASGFIVYLNGRQAAKEAAFNGKATNNFAEYNAVILAMKWCMENIKPHRESALALYSDSELVVRQLSGQYKIKAKKMQELNAEARALSKNFASVSFSNLPRSERHIVAVDRHLNSLLDSIEKGMR